MKRIGLNEHFTYRKLFLFTLPSVVMAIFTSVYTIVDGVFVSRVVGDSAFTGLNLIFPMLMILGAIGLMFGAGGSALIAKTLGEGDRERANGYFSFFLIVIAIAGVVFAALVFALLRPVAELIGKRASREAVEYSILYGGVCLIGLPFLMLQYSFQSFMLTAEKATLGFFVTVIAGVTNAILDATFILGFHWGLAGAAAATVVGQVLGGLIPVLYFARKNNSLLHITKPRFEWRALVKACTNGSSEFLTNISAAIVNMLYNMQLLRLAGDSGVNAFGVIMYENTVFMGIFFGYAMGVAPAVGYHFGAQNRKELHNLLKKSLLLVGVAGLVLALCSVGLSSPFAHIFAKEESVYVLTRDGIRIYSVAYVMMGFGVFASSFFTALNNGFISALISFLRTCVFQCGAILLLPLLWDITGVWISTAVAEALSLAVCIFCFVFMRKKYGY